MYFEHENYMKTDNEEKPMWEIARDAYCKSHDPYDAPNWSAAVDAVIAEHERRKAALDTDRQRRCAEADMKQLIHEFVNEQADPNAECKKAFAAGKRIQYFSSSFREWRNSGGPLWDSDVRYRVHPDDVEQEPFASEKAAFAAGKTIQYYSKSSLEWLDCDPYPPTWMLDFRYRVKPDPDPFADAKRWFVEGRLQHSLRGVWEDWNAPDSPPTWKQWSVEQFRERPEPKWVPLGPEDVPSGTVLRGAGEVGTKSWCMIVSCSETGIRMWHASDTNPHERTWQHLFDSGAEINLSIPNLGKWVADAWVPCRRRQYES